MQNILMQKKEKKSFKYLTRLNLKKSCSKKQKLLV